MKGKLRQKQIRERKNFFPTLAVTILLWIALFGLVYFVEPDTFGAFFVFFALVFFALLFTFSTAFANSRRGLLTASALTLFLILRSLGVGHIINFLLIAGVTISIEIYFAKNSAST
ncbi:hypothetical protein A2V61_03825 [Candidatus Woesebacteria bacterium RBG_19FT_COMBO_47_8]|uniref:Uncharacterized protein n=1 Tax=Candidatus Woesebacteria bacterium RBG_13_46_13 TaxID=1802479 RepID=A0A1F7X526_9BACT|nr:MAG: hypothetical protein A2Y68_02075 [Candidatus Woesebacteria bacterium RBG_13_46_13]OGM16799.1 MAG: hypothetical protein A2V61_03825 [Candidatus Woesebacteria bacterium RBG_19FT_COMBO_47_8]HJX59370.1 hypothetical protein [Patescibacteria group bacterium]